MFRYLLMAEADILPVAVEELEESLEEGLS
jgi:hypothetical protein